LIGYTDSTWIIKNQWGEGWGNGGFIEITRDPLHNCAIGNSVHFFTNVIDPQPNDSHYQFTGISSDTNNSVYACGGIYPPCSEAMLLFAAAFLLVFLALF
jgi:hypothetical protein